MGQMTREGTSIHHPALPHRKKNLLCSLTHRSHSYTGSLLCRPPSTLDGVLTHVELLEVGKQAVDEQEEDNYLDLAKSSLYTQVVFCHIQLTFRCLGSLRIDTHL